MDSKLPLLKTILRVLSFRVTGDELKLLDRRFLFAGLLGTWLVGMGRHWDAPTGNLARDLGVGSLGYVFVLALLLFLVGAPLRPKNWSYVNVLTFVTLTSFPAALYAFPVERWTDINTAQQLNMWFLFFVATYRVSLYAMYAKRLGGLNIPGAVVSTFVPILLIINALNITGLSGVVFDIMAGLRDPTSEDLVHAVLLIISFTSCITLPLALVVYSVVATDRRKELTNLAKGAERNAQMEQTKEAWKVSGSDNDSAGPS